ncbi:MAG: hypothetical protein H0Z28_13950 [Archaeoglobus sp.]|nr:hypothetical protein [Archaeoglobus sp.]
MILEKVPLDIAERWIKILIEEGIDEEVAENIVAVVRGDPELIFGEPDENTVEVVREILDELDLEKFGVVDGYLVKEEMLRELETRIQEITRVSYEKETLIPVIAVREGDLREIDPMLKLKHSIVKEMLEKAKDRIQEDLGDVKLDEVEDVLTRVAMSALTMHEEKYEEVLKLALYGDDPERDKKFESLKERIRELMKDK